MLRIDHLVIVCETLKDGQRYVETTLGVAMCAGGKHAYFGTHNMLLGLADGLYLEVVAIDPDAPPPGHPRWFGLDRFQGEPRLAHWVARSDALEADLRQSYGAEVQPLPLSRGDLEWRMGLPSDGTLPLDGLFPAMIEWAGNSTAADRLPASGCRLTGLTLGAPDPERTKKQIAPLMDDARLGFASCPAPSLAALIATPNGEVTLR